MRANIRFIKTLDILFEIVDILLKLNIMVLTLTIVGYVRANTIFFKAVDILFEIVLILIK